MEGGGDNVIQSQHPMYNHQNHNLRLDTNQLNNNNHDNHSIHSNSSLNDSDTVCSQDKKKPFTEEEIKFIRNDLIKYDSTEAPRKLYWRFIQNFTDWKNDQKSYLKFYQKFWTLTNENKELLNLPIKKESHSIVHNKPQNGVSNINPLKRKRSIYTVIPKYPNIIPPQKKLKL